MQPVLHLRVRSTSVVCHDGVVQPHVGISASYSPDGSCRQVERVGRTATCQVLTWQGQAHAIFWHPANLTVTYRKPPDFDPLADCRLTGRSRERSGML